MPLSRDPSWRDKWLIAAIHLPPLPGSSKSPHSFDLDPFLDRVRSEAIALEKAGFDRAIIENFGDAPFWPDQVEPHTIALLTTAALEVSRSTSLRVGVNVLRNDAKAALGVSVASGAEFIRVNVHTGVSVTDQGMITGRAAETLRYRRVLGASVQILADVNVKHAKALGQDDWEYVTEETLERGGADGVIVSGATTGRPPEASWVRRVREAAGDKPVLLGSGFSLERGREWLDLVDGVIVSSVLRQDGRAGTPLDPDRLKHFAAWISA